MVLKELKIKRNSGKPVSEQIASFVKSKIYRRELKAGSKLPTTQEIMDQFGVGSNTVRQAIQSLKDEGLVKPVPRLGTIVNELEADAKMGRGFSNQKEHMAIAVTGLLAATNETVLFRPETAEGIIRECERLGAVMINLPQSFLQLSPEALSDKLSGLGCSGLVYHNDGLSDEHLDCLSAKGIAAITARRFRCKDGRACVESDFDGAGYDVGLYYYSLGLNKVTVFSHYELTCSQSEAKRNGYTLGLKHGIGRAYESKGIEPDIDFVVNESWGDVETSKRILSKLESISINSGIVFTNAYQLQSLFNDFPEEAKKFLRDKKVTVIGNKTSIVDLERRVGGIDVMVLLDRFKKVGSMTVSMLAGMIEGYLPKNSTALADIKFMPFDEAVKK
jgi:GntR family transcriptional regulator